MSTNTLAEAAEIGRTLGEGTELSLKMMEVLNQAGMLQNNRTVVALLVCARFASETDMPDPAAFADLAKLVAKYLILRETGKVT